MNIFGYKIMFLPQLLCDISVEELFYDCQIKFKVVPDKIKLNNDEDVKKFDNFEKSFYAFRDRRSYIIDRIKEVRAATRKPRTLLLGELKDVEFLEDNDDTISEEIDKWIHKIEKILNKSEAGK